jgi:adenine-specific DNA-methyltransferase
MKLKTKTPKQVMKAYLKQGSARNEMNAFKENLITLLDKIKLIEERPKDESEEHLKNNLRDFLLNTFYRDTNAINTKDKKDLVIHLDKTINSAVGVIIEAKRPNNLAEMITADDANKKALHELILYYLGERKAGNNQLKQLIITNVNEWYIIDANYFDKHIYRNTKIEKDYETKLNDKKDNPWFYEEIKKRLNELDIEIPCVYFNIKDYDTILRNSNKEDDKELNALLKILSPQHLLKIATPNDSNSLDDKFYKELLHIIGLEEAKEGAKNIIRRKKENRNPASLLETTIEAIQTEEVLHRIPDQSIYGTNKEEKTFNVALELCITWINRILFLKLLEGQLIRYHLGNQTFRFLNPETINDFDELFKLFHKILAVNLPERNDTIKSKYSRVPYLNSSLFEISELEDQTIKINSLDNSGKLELITGTVLTQFKNKAKSLPTLDYLFHFLDAYNFASDGTNDVQEDNKIIINASVLGKVFEKINGYKDGSIYTPGFITMYMCRKAIRLAVIQKFKDKYGWNIEHFDDIKNYLSDKKSTKDILEFNEIINSLRLCDPAVGSGHFLVSSLNEIIVIKYELGLIADKTGNRIRDYEFEIISDEIIITDSKGDIVEYKLQDGKPITKEIQRLQKTLFYEKQTIIENCLFGVDINPNSVKICRLRLWIELLKNAYYKEETNFTELETLPNIDINIKCGNSLLSRFALNDDISDALKKIKYDIAAYRDFVNRYKNEKSRETKRELENIIRTIKTDFKTEITDKDTKKLKKYTDALNELLNQGLLFNTAKEKKDREVQQKQLEASISKSMQDIEAIKANAIYKNAFEWRFEFPEVLSNDGIYEGFDVVVGNPPYGVKIEIINLEILQINLSKWKSSILPDSYFGFIPLGLFIGKRTSQLSYIVPNTWRLISSGKEFRDEMITNGGLYNIDTYLKPIFEEAVVDCDIIFLDKQLHEAIKLNVNAADIFIKSNLIDQKILLAQSSINSHLGIREYTLLDKIKINCINLNEILSIKNGVKPYEVGKGNPKQTKKILEEKPFTQTTKVDDTFLPLIGGSNFHRYLIKWDNDNFISYGSWLAAPRDKSIFEAKEKIIVRQTSDTLIATIISEGFIMRNNTHILLSDNKGYSLKYILALLNSSLFDFIYWTINPERGEALAEVKAMHLDQLPIKQISESDQKPFIDLVDKVLLAKQKDKDSKEYEDEIDTLVYKLYGITKMEREIIEKK